MGIYFFGDVCTKPFPLILLILEQKHARTVFHLVKIFNRANVFLTAKCISNIAQISVSLVLGSEIPLSHFLCFPLSKELQRYWHSVGLMWEICWTEVACGPVVDYFWIYIYIYIFFILPIEQFLKQSYKYLTTSQFYYHNIYFAKCSLVSI